MTEVAPRIRLFLPQELGAGAPATLDRDHANYLFNVMRRGVGDPIRVFNARDGEWRAEIAEAGKRGGALTILERTRPPETPLDLWLLFSPLKKTRTDFVVEKATELGCAAIRPVRARRTVAERVNAQRLRALAVEAAEQCERVFVPEIGETATLAATLAAWDPARRLYFCDETRDAPPLIDIVEAGPAAILIGPEGGFAPEEAADLRARPFVRPAALGPRILRAETAAAAALAVWQAAVGDWR